MSEHRDPVSLFSHIFKTPLTSIKAGSDLLNKHLSGNVTPKDENIISMVVRNARTLEMRINRLLEMMQSREAGIILDLNEDQLEDIHSLKFEFEAAAEPAAQAASGPAAQPAPATEAPRVSSKKKTILVADDTADIRNLVAEALKDDGYHVEEAKDGETAWYVIKNYKPDVLILDGLMPKKDGFTLSKDAKSLDPETYEPKVILMTAVYKKLHYQSEAKLKFGVDEYMVKPFEIEDLLTNVHKLLGEI